jgi:ubiquinone/menaquinone biosynthesis C-methylase UbiE
MEDGACCDKMIRLSSIRGAHTYATRKNKDKPLYLWKEYWAGLAKAYGAADPNGFSAVLHPGAPNWFNAMVDRIQEVAWQQGTQACGLHDGARVLDVGCGTGRWLRRYVRKNSHPVGLDATQGMLQHAFGITCPLVVASAQSLPFKSNTFEIVSAITVIQHIPPTEQTQALREIARVLQPGGYVLLIDLIHGAGAHVFSRSPEGWIAEARSCGLDLISWRGQEFLLLDRSLNWFVQSLRRSLGQTSGSGLPVPAAKPPRGKSLYWAIRRVACTLSEWLEPLTCKVCPNSWATHGLFVFRKA